MIKYKDICVEFPWSVHIWGVDFASEVYLGGKVRDKLFTSNIYQLSQWFLLSNSVLFS